LNAWQSANRRIEAAVNRLTQFPFEGSIPDELLRLNLPQFRQVIAGRNRILYEVKQGTILVHLVADTRRDYVALLARRLFR
jgi:toxin ParE1/3/4